LVVAALVAGGPAGAGLAQPDPRVAPGTTTSADGRTVTDGQRTLSTSQVTDLDPAGQQVAVAGSGYDEAKGIYVALCVIPPKDHLPTPCGGGVDTEGQAGAAQWISSNPPDYGEGLAQPYGPGGSFSTSFAVRSEISPGIDCRQVRCALVTRNDHTRTADRSQDLLIPVTFGAGAAPAGPTDPGPAEAAPPVVEVPDTAAPPPEPSRAPAARVSDDGREATDGTRTLRVGDATDLDPERARVAVTGSGYDADAGIYVALCALDDDDTTPPGPCTAGAPTAAWISSSPPDHSTHLATAYGEGGSFEVELEVSATIDGATDCRQVTCGMVTRFDDDRPGDRAGDLAVPVTFAARSAATPGEDVAAPGSAGPDLLEADLEDAASRTGSGDAPGPLMALAIGLPASVGAAAAAVGRRHLGRRDPDRAGAGTP
jgi:hypothetical protein